MNIKKSKFKVMIMLCMTMIMVLGSTLSVFAYGSANEVFQAHGYGSADKKSSVTSYLKTQPFDGCVEVQCPDGNTYYYDPSKEEAIVNAGNKINAQSKEAAQSTEITTTIDSNIEDVGGYKADTGTATALLSGFTGVIQTLLGIIVILISVGMTVFSAFDLCYIAFPVFRNKCEEAKQSGGKSMHTKTGSNGETKLRFVSDDAQYAVIAADTVQQGKNPFVIYFGKRLMSYLVLAILLFVLFTGKITVFTSIAIRLVSGLINIISGI